LLNGTILALIKTNHMTPTADTQNLFKKSLSTYGNWLLLIIISFVLILMILPLGPALLDALLAFNLIGALTILMMAISIGHPLKLTSFPTLLLVTTLFRLGLNISSTRMILAHGQAGKIIQTFGVFVSHGNTAVGLVIFLILTIVQFIVIAKGAERVAEVAARFTLDALPGKQMSIDADLRAGIISQDQALRQRENLQQESKLYGAMDGAMKFVKGDAIAGLLITVINLIGGLFSGIVQQGLELEKAIRTYSLLTIGDGLVSQIPALLLSIAAGFIITRVSSEKNTTSLGTDISSELLAKPEVLFKVALLSFLIGLIPGFPFWLFMTIALVISALAVWLIHKTNREATKLQPVSSYMIHPDTQTTHFLGQAIPLVMEVAPELYSLFVTDPKWTHCLGILYPKLKWHLTNQLGVVFPDLKLTVNEGLANSFRYRILIYEVPVDTGLLTPQQCTYIGAYNQNENLPQAPDHLSETVHGTPISLWNIQMKNKLSQNGILTFGPDEMLLRHLGKVLKRHSGDFIGIQEVRDLLNRVEMCHPELVSEVVPKMMSIQKLTEITKRLVEEGVPIKDFRLILQTLSASQPETKDPVTLTEQVRIGLKRTITFMHMQHNQELGVLTLNGDIEDEIRSAIQQNGSECYLALPPERLNTLIDSFRNTIDRSIIQQKRVVVLTHLDIRRYVRKIIENDFEDLEVLSFQELDPKALINVVATINSTTENVAGERFELST
jgi:type III secretion protein V